MSLTRLVGADIDNQKISLKSPKLVPKPHQSPTTIQLQATYNHAKPHFDSVLANNPTTTGPEYNVKKSAALTSQYLITSFSSKALL